MKLNLLRNTLISLGLLGTASGAYASAFQLAEVSTSGLGRAYAGEAAIADNAAVVATNPALMTKFNKTEFTAGGVYVDSKINLSGPLTVTNAISGATITTTSANHESIVPGAFVPNMYIVHPINDRFAIGAGMNVNFGLKSEFDDNYTAGIFGGTTDLTAINMNLSGAYKISQGWSFGLGLNAVYAKAEVERTAGIVGPIAASALGMNTTTSTPMAHLKGDAWGVGWNAGLMYEINERNRFGLAYHSHVDIDFKDSDALSYQRTASGLPGPYNSLGRLTLNLPAYWEFSGFHQLTDKFAAHYSVKITEWSRFKELCGTYDNGVGGHCGALKKTENFQDNTRISLGGTYDVNDKLTLRAGIAFDESAEGGHSSASIPDTDRTWYSLGATYNFTPDLSVDLGYAHLRGSKTSFTETQTIAGVLKVDAEYTSKSRANLYGLNVNYRF